MKTSISHLPTNKQQELQRVTQLIAETIAPEKILLYGSYATGEWQEDRYTEKHLVYGFDSDYDILVVTKSGDRRKDYEISSQVTNLLRYRVPINVITHDVGYINEKLSIGQYFFTEIIKQGILLYDTGKSVFVEPKELSPSERRTIAQKDFETWFESAERFLNASRLIKDNLGALKESVFNLHQAAERTFNSLILVYTGYKPKTHNLDKLMQQAQCYSFKVTEIFPRNSSQEEHYFNLLQKGYIEARYSDEYSISAQELNTLICRVVELQKLVRIECLKKIEEIGQASDLLSSDDL